MIGFIRKWWKLRKRRAHSKNLITLSGYDIWYDEDGYRCWTCNERRYVIYQRSTTTSLAGEVFLSQTKTNCAVCLRCTAITVGTDNLNHIELKKWCQAQVAANGTLESFTYRQLKARQ